MRRMKKKKLTMVLILSHVNPTFLTSWTLKLNPMLSILIFVHLKKKKKEEEKGSIQEFNLLQMSPQDYGP
jgi:hypothetical protein